MIGLKRGTVKLVKYNYKWKDSFENEESKLRKVFGNDLIDSQHIGSTAIPGILAKPIVDIGLIVSSFSKVDRYIEKLREIGYELKKDDNRKERLFFTKGPEEKRTHYLHIGEKGSGYIEEMIIFRNYLSKNKDAAEKYSELKEELASKYEDKREIYTQKKEDFIKKIINNI